MSTCQGQHPDGSPCRNPAPEGQTRCYIHRRPDPAARLTREDVLAAIEERGGPEGLDLSHEDLVGIDLGREAISGELRRKPRVHEVSWYLSRYTQGVRLAGTKLQGANLYSADLRRADLYMANLHSAKLERGLLMGARLLDARLEEADLFRANLRGADLRWAHLDRVDLRLAVDIRDILWHGVILGKTQMSREQLGDNIKDELMAQQWEKGSAHQWGNEYDQARKNNCEVQLEKLKEEHERNSYDRARQAYLALKNNFRELGRYDDASWAYRKERRMERAMSRPCRAAREYRDEKERLEKEHPHTRLGHIGDVIFGMVDQVRIWNRDYDRQYTWKLRFYTRRGWKWWGDTIAEGLTDYGESPGRTVLAALATWFLFGLAYGFFGNVGSIELAKVETVKLFDPGAVFTYSAAALGTVGLESLRPLDRLTEVLTALEGIVGISLLALLMFTLGNRISRS